MTDRFSILLVGLKAPAEPLAVGHFTQAGHGVTTAASPSEAREKTPRVEIIYLQPTSDSKAVEELEQLISICPGPRLRSSVLRQVARSCWKPGKQAPLISWFCPSLHSH